MVQSPLSLLVLDIISKNSISSSIIEMSKFRYVVSSMFYPPYPGMPRIFYADFIESWLVSTGIVYVQDFDLLALSVASPSIDYTVRSRGAIDQLTQPPPWKLISLFILRKSRQNGPSIPPPQQRKFLPLKTLPRMLIVPNHLLPEKKIFRLLICPAVSAVPNVTLHRMVIPNIIFMVRCSECCSTPNNCFPRIIVGPKRTCSITRSDCLSRKFNCPERCITPLIMNCPECFITPHN